MTQEELLQDLRSLRAAAERAGATFLLRLVEVEQTMRAEIQSWGFDTALSYFLANKLVHRGRFLEFKLGIEQLDDPQKALELGEHAVKEMGRRKAELNAGLRERFIRGVLDFRELSGGVFPSEEKAREDMNRLLPSRESPSTTTRRRRDDELARLRAENKELRAQIKSLQHQLDQTKRKTQPAHAS